MMLIKKSKILSNNNCKFADFGTRRRRSFYTQDLVVKTMKNTSGFVGTIISLFGYEI